jgi:hypothetical protein
MGKPRGRNGREHMSQLGNERVSNRDHDVVTTEIWGAVAAATWFRRLAETKFEFPFD